MRRKSIIYNDRLVPVARKLRGEMTAAEKRLWYGCLCQFPHRVLRQRPIGEYIADFYCAALRLVIEIDGDTHYTNEGKAKDACRTRYLESLGLRVVRFTNRDVLKNLDGVSARLLEMADTAEGRE